MIHAYDRAGRARCGERLRNQGDVRVTQALYADLCPRCIRAILASCARREGKA